MLLDLYKMSSSNIQGFCFTFKRHKNASSSLSKFTFNIFFTGLHDYRPPVGLHTALCAAGFFSTNCRWVWGSKQPEILNAVILKLDTAVQRVCGVHKQVIRVKTSAMLLRASTPQLPCINSTLTACASHITECTDLEDEDVPVRPMQTSDLQTSVKTDSRICYTIKTGNNEGRMQRTICFCFRGFTEKLPSTCCR